MVLLEDARRVIAAAEKKAKGLVDRARKGEKFTDLARQYSDAATATADGELGIFKRGDLAKDIDDIVFKQNKGYVTDPIRRPAGFEIYRVDEHYAAGQASLDEVQGEIYRADIAPNIRDGAALLFAHGLNIHFRLIEPKPSIDVLMVAPKGPGHTVRGEYVRGGGVPCLIAVDQDATGGALDLGLAYASAIGGGRSGIIETNFREECETDLFGEQTVLCGGLVELIRAGFETLVEAGYAPEMAYFEWLHEVKLIVDLIYEGGIANMDYSVSNTAEYGQYVSGPRVVTAETKAEMKRILEDIQSGRFVRDWMVECAAGQPSFKATRRRNAEHPIEEVGARLRAMMPWISKNALVDKAKN